MPTTPDPKAALKVAADLKAQIDAVNKQMADLKTAQIVANSPSEKTYFDTTKATQVKDAAIQEFADAYKSLYDKYRGVTMSTGTVTGHPNKKAFYIFDATSEATRGADNAIRKQKQTHEQYIQQQEAIKNWLAQQQQTGNAQMYQMFLNDMMKQNHSMLQQGYIMNNSVLFDMDKWNKTKPKDRTSSWNWSTGKSSYGYKDPTAVKAEMDALNTMYQSRFNSTKSIQDDYRNKYMSTLQAQAKDLNAQYLKAQAILRVKRAGKH